MKMNMFIEAHSLEKPLHKKNPDLGFKQTAYSNELYLEYDDGFDLVVGEEVDDLIVLSSR